MITLMARRMVMITLESRQKDANKTVQGTDVAGDDSTETPKIDAKGPNNGNNSHGGSADDKYNNDQNTDDVNDEDEANKEDALTALYDYIGELKGKVQKAVMAAKDIEHVLGLTKTPNFHKPKERAYFCSLRSNDMKWIKKLYEGDDSEEVKAEIAKKEWISPLVQLMLALGWQSSIRDLPENSSYSEDDEILLWNGGEVCEKFMTPLE